MRHRRQPDKWTVDGKVWKAVHMPELKELWAHAEKRRILYNGMTFDLIRARYGDVCHRPNEGFYRPFGATKRPLNDRWFR